MRSIRFKLLHFTKFFDCYLGVWNSMLTLNWKKIVSNIKWTTPPLWNLCNVPQFDIETNYYPFSVSRWAHPKYSIYVSVEILNGGNFMWRPADNFKWWPLDNICDGRQINLSGGRQINLSGGRHIILSLNLEKYLRGGRQIIMWWPPGNIYKSPLIPMGFRIILPLVQPVHISRCLTTTRWALLTGLGTHAWFHSPTSQTPGYWN